MKLFVWESYVFADYSVGDIIAIGKDVEDARAKVIEHYKDHEYASAINHEVSKEPVEIRKGVFHIYGSA